MSGRFHQEMLVAGGGIGGLAAALACEQAGWRARIFESSAVFGEVGAGLQLGPNAMRRLHAWDLAEPLAAVAAFPDLLQIRSASTDRPLGSLRLGRHVQARYGAPYATLHRADLHAVLLQVVAQKAEVVMHAGTRVTGVRPHAHAVTVTTTRTLSAAGSDLPEAADSIRPESASPVGAPELQRDVEGDALIAADGLWSQVRAACLPDDPAPRITGHVAYRTLVQQATLPATLRSNDVTVWLGDRLHAVAYPVRGGEWLNLVVLAQQVPAAQAASDPRRWNAVADATDVATVLAASCGRLRALQESAPAWGRWMLCDRPPLTGPDGMAAGRIALLGDAAHPMLPYLAQGAGMAIEDAAELQRMLAMEGVDVALRLRRYAMHRWQRAARVQATAERNARVFHARGPVRWGRDVAMRLLGERLLDQPWLYGA